MNCLQPRHKRRCEAPPGLTGLWQVSGKNKTTFEEKIDLDLNYVREKSLWMDLKIIALTIPAILQLGLGNETAAKTRNEAGGECSQD